MIKQKTINQEVCVKGKGIHTGKHVSLTFKPAPENSGIKFIRIDLEGRPEIPAVADYVFDTSRGTSLKNGNAIVRTVEHALAAIAGCDLDNVIIEIDQEETPILDGSSRFFTEALLSVGVKEQNAERKIIHLNDVCKYRDDEKDVDMELVPDDSYKISTTIDYNSKILKMQTAEINDLSEFNSDFSIARTFVFISEIQQLIKYNLIKGGDLDNAIVFVDKILSSEELDEMAKFFNQPKMQVLDEGILNNLSLRFLNEPARHKTLDIVGDLVLVGFRFNGHVYAKKPGHKTNVEFAKLLRNKILNSHE